MKKLYIEDYKAIICDFDGTLVGRDLEIPKLVQDAIRSLNPHKLSFSLASGRSFIGPIQETSELLHLTSPVMTRGGAEIIDPISNKVLHSELIPDKDFINVYNFLNKHSVEFTVESGDYIYTKTGEGIKELGNVNLKKLSELPMHDIPKVVVGTAGDFKTDDVMESTLKDNFKTLHITKAHSPSGKCWDITAGLANKHIAALKLAELMMISPKQIIAIGDGYNDFPLLQACGYKVVVENANDELKKIADKVIPSYKDGGVGSFINSFLGLL